MKDSMILQPEVVEPKHNQTHNYFYKVMAVVNKYHYHIADKPFQCPAIYGKKSKAYDAMEILVIDKYNCKSDTTICRDRRTYTVGIEDYDYQDITEVTRFYIKPVKELK